MITNISREGQADDKGFSNIFIVHSVSAISRVDKPGRESKNPSSEDGRKTPQKNFRQFLAEASEEQKESAKGFSHATYGRDCMIHFFTYQPEKYRC